jgi:hypothetical protein
MNHWRLPKGQYRSSLIPEIYYSKQHAVVQGYESSAFKK